ncbi:hypothetical protein SBY92_004899 [Candida maltosa Xu316]
MNESQDRYNKSISQPVTPPRLSSSESVSDQSHSLPNSILRSASQRSFLNIRLPSHGLSETNARLFNQSRTRESNQDRARTPVYSNRASSLTPRRRRPQSSTRMSVTPERRRSRRRSSIITMENGDKIYEPNYRGPVTLDYLSVYTGDENIKQRKLENPFIDDDDDVSDVEPEEHTLDNDEFNDSLPIPPDYNELMASPTQKGGEETQKNIDGTPENSHISPEMEKPIQKPKPLSYLQKILLQKSKSKSFLSEKSFETPSTDIQSGVDLSPQVGNADDAAQSEDSTVTFKIRDNSIIRNQMVYRWKVPRPSEGTETLSPTQSLTDSKIEIPTGFKEMFDGSGNRLSESTTNLLGLSQLHWDNSESDTEAKSEEQATTSDDHPEEHEEQEGTSLVESHQNNNIDASPLDSDNRPDFSPQDAQQVTPEQSIISNGIYEQDNNVPRDDFLFDDSILGVNDDLNNEAEGLFVSERPETQQRGELIRIIPQKRPRSESRGLEVAYADVSYIAKFIETQNFLEANLPVKKKSSKPRGFNKDIINTIRSRSNEFLDSLMDDLKSYANHRNSNEVEMKDVLLYLQRVKFASQQGTSSKGTERIVELAQRFLPLENLIALDNNLNENVGDDE